ncbi:hypothetical protein [Leisingera sp. M523]|uniref:hypothetical protein n=1 Tax=Leisingera sp. M523 TaxID=2867013 RepID=UPI0021A4FC1B|nr:hypothetical protein [Leisingera sp. M523]UWQ29069.1 hypothetical protein K3557_00210 [Leisingera sp. M523]
MKTADQKISLPKAACLATACSQSLHVAAASEVLLKNLLKLPATYPTKSKRFQYPASPSVAQHQQQTGDK